ncbi:hypothetical protein IQ250_02805 [Pseudanabaenaceae cyanobacterium LEGE 13415]|nr:hypothetical protein [Pseudanabaenaceae cyanobacterium LEGE 13415]
MCNAWNHPPGCNCGWGGNAGGSRYRGFVNLSSIPLSSSYQSNLYIRLTSELRKAETKRTCCRWCNALVYYHTNGYGDAVLFDQLGHPWQVHHCWREYSQQQREQKSNNFQNPLRLRMAILVGTIRGMKFLPDETTVASDMGISVEELRNTYGDFYEVDSYTKAMIIGWKPKNDQAEAQTESKSEVVKVRKKPAPPKKKAKPAPPKKKNKRDRPKKSD